MKTFNRRDPNILAAVALFLAAVKAAQDSSLAPRVAIARFRFLLNDASESAWKAVRRRA
jgi:hypothetical protein